MKNVMLFKIDRARVSKITLKTTQMMLITCGERYPGTSLSDVPPGTQNALPELHNLSSRREGCLLLSLSLKSRPWTLQVEAYSELFTVSYKIKSTV